MHGRLAWLFKEGADHLDALARGYQKSGPAQMRARALVGEIAETRVEEIFDEGLHEFLTRFIRDVSELSDMVQGMYLSGRRTWVLAWPVWPWWSAAALFLSVAVLVQALNVLRDLLALLHDCVPDEGVRRRILVDNPARLYGF